MPTYKLTIAYDGTEFVGWQRQATGTSVQGLIEAALAKLAGCHVGVTGAGRTDAGVHALGQVASFSIDRAIDAATLVRAINARLPASVRILCAEHARATFNARFAARSKTYRYRLWIGDVLDPFERHYVWHVTASLDRSAMARAARRLEGRHNFAAFQAVGNSTRTAEREVFASVLKSVPTEAGALVVYEIRGDGFLRHMVRTMVGSLVEIGCGRRSEDWIVRLLDSRDRSEAGPTAPARGLFLVEVDYEEAPLPIPCG